VRHGSGVAMSCSVLQCVAVCCSVLQCVAVSSRGGAIDSSACVPALNTKHMGSVLQRVAVCCNVLQCVAVC